MKAESENSEPIPSEESEDDAEEDSTSFASVTTGNTSRSRSATPTNAVRKGNQSKSNPRMRCPYKFASYTRELSENAIFGVTFNYHITNKNPIFASVGGNRVYIYECLENGNIKMHQCIGDPDPEEIFYTCAWSYGKDRQDVILAAAGLRGIIRILYPNSPQNDKHYSGHGHAINELKFHPKKPNIFVSASKDHSLRLWNIKTDVCIAIFGGVEGHRDEVLSVDFHNSGDRIMSSGMDHSLKMWRLDKKTMSDAITNSETFDVKSNIRPFRTVEEHFPDFSTRDIHSNYVDCVKWMGDHVLSKSCDKSIILWMLGTFEDQPTARSRDSATILHRFEYDVCKIWFIRFALDLFCRYMALGDAVGKTFLWDLDVPDPKEAKMWVLKHPKCTTAVRQTTFSRNGNVLICVCDDGTIWRWDKC